MTSFARIVIVLSFVRTALATQQMPPNQVIIGLSLFLTFFIMSPTLQEVNENALTPLFDEEITLEEAYTRASGPFKDFMSEHTRQKDLELFLSYTGAEQPASIEEIPLTIMVPAFEVIEGINSIVSDKPIFQVVMPLPESWEKYRRDSLTKKPLFRNPEDPAKVISNILFYSQRKSRRKLLLSKTSEIDLSNASGFLDQAKIERLCSAYDIPFIKSLLVKKNFNKKSELPHYPLVLKGLSKNVIHKSEFNAVKLNLKNEDELRKAAQEITNGFRQNNFEVEEFLIQPFITTKHEILIGGFRDNSFGPMIMFGSGGKYVEVFQDTYMKSAYLSDEDVDEMIDSTKIGKILRGVRGESPADLITLKKIILSSAQMMLDNPNIMEFDFNPLVVATNNSFHAVDVRIKI
jgi:acyl-CoA synthetase (NDP forming)